MNYRTAKSQLSRIRWEIAAVKRAAKARYGSRKEDWPPETLWRYDYLKRCAIEFQEMVHGEMAA